MERFPAPPCPTGISLILKKIAAPEISPEAAPFKLGRASDTKRQHRFAALRCRRCE
jgi:hypothetical protein